MSRRPGAAAVYELLPDAIPLRLHRGSSAAGMLRKRCVCVHACGRAAPWDTRPRVRHLVSFTAPLGSTRASGEPPSVERGAGWPGARRTACGEDGSSLLSWAPGCVHACRDKVGNRWTDSRQLSRRAGHARKAGRAGTSHTVVAAELRHKGAVGPLVVEDVNGPKARTRRVGHADKAKVPTRHGSVQGRA